MRGAAAVRDRGHPFIRAPLEQQLELALLARSRDEVGRMRKRAAKAAHDVHVGLSERVRGTRVAVGDADRREPGRRLERRRAQLRALQRQRLVELADRDPEILEALRDRRCAVSQRISRGLLILISPSPVLASAC